MNKIVQAKEKQKCIVDRINKTSQPYRNILFEVYIQGKSLVTVASEMSYSYEDICRKHGKALKLFETYQ